MPKSLQIFIILDAYHFIPTPGCLRGVSLWERWLPSIRRVTGGGERSTWHGGCQKDDAGGGDALLVGTALMERPEMLGELIL